MFKKILIAFLILFCIPSNVFAFKAETFVSVIHYVSGNSKDLFTNVQTTYQVSTPSATFNDWLISGNTLKNSSVSAYLKLISEKDDHQSIGLFLEDSNPPIDKMTLPEKKLYIDSQMESFFETFKVYPRFVSSKVIDTQSLIYLQSKYSLLNFTFLPSKHNQLPSESGGYKNAPYIANNRNFYLPSNSSDNRLPIVIDESIKLDNLDITATIQRLSQKNFNEFTFVSFWDDLSTKTGQGDFKNLIYTIHSLSDKYGLNQKSINYFSDWYLSRYPESTPAFYFNSDGNHLYQSPWYQLNFSQYNHQLQLKKLTVYPSSYYDPSYTVPNPGESGIQSLPNIEFGAQDLQNLDDDLYFSHLKNFDYWKMSLKNSTQELSLLPDSISFTNIFPKDPQSNLLVINKNNSQITWGLKKQDSHSSLLIYVALIAIIALFFLKKKDGNLLLIGLLLSVLASFICIRSGLSFPFGLGFWGPHGHDAIFHLSLIEKFSQNQFNLSHPQITNEKITNYHLFFDYISGIIVRITKMSSEDYYFRYFPIVIGGVIVYLLNSLFDSLKLNSKQKVASYLLVFFGSSFGYLVRLFQGNNLFSGESAFWSNQSLSMYLNPPFLLSIVFILTFFNIYKKEKLNKADYLLLILCGGILSQVKVYAFILLTLALFLTKEYTLSIFVGFAGLLISLPFSRLGGFPFVFNPLWFPRTMFESADRVYLQTVASAWQTYDISGQFGKIWILSIMATVVFLVGNLGIRVLGILYIVKNKVQNKTDALIRSLIFLSLIFPLLVTQTVNPWNSIQFLYYGLFFLGVYTVYLLPQKKYFAVFVIAFGVFGSLGTIKDYLTLNSSSRISHQELLGLSILKQQETGLVISPLYLGQTRLYSPVPLYDYVSTAYISAISGQPEYLSDTINLDITGINYQTKKKELQRFYNTNDVLWAKNFLRENNIIYVYETPLKHLTLSPDDLSLLPLYLSNEINIYKVKQ